MKTSSTKAETRERATEPGGDLPKPNRLEVPVEDIDPDPENRTIFEDEEFEGLVESVKVLGVLQALQVQRVGSRFFLIDGERRWKAARLAGRTTVPCDVWPESASARDMLVAGVALNEHRTNPSCMHVARRLRQIKNEHAETNEGVAVRVGLKVDRVKAYLALFKVSEELLQFFDSEEIPLAIATEFVRYEKVAGESATRQLVKRYLEAPLSRRELAALRKRRDEEDGTKSDKPVARTPRPLSAFIDAAFRRDAGAALAELEAAVLRLGFRLVPTDGAERGDKEKV